MLPRTLEPEVMDCVADAVDYDAMDHAGVNRVFVDDLLAAWNGSPISAESDPRFLDVGTGTAQIPIELCARGGTCRVVAIDLAREMLKLGERNVAQAGLSHRIELCCVDAKSLPDPDGHYSAVISNSIIHHIPEPRLALQEMWRVLAPGGLLFVRDLYRPDDVATIDRLVAAYAGDANPHQRQLFRDSFFAALTLAEIRALAAELGIAPDSAVMTSDRHWTLGARKPAS